MSQLLREVSDNIQKLESLQSEIESQIRLNRRIYHQLYDYESKPDIRGMSFPDDQAYPDNIVHNGETAEFVAYARYNPYFEQWDAFLEWEIDGKQGAADPECLGGFDDAEEALQVANSGAEKSSIRSNKLNDLTQ